MPKSKIFFYFCISFIIGIFIASFLVINFSFILIGFGALIILAINKRTRLAGGFLFLFLLGTLRCGEAFKVSKENVQKLADGHSHIIRGIVIDEPDDRLAYTNLTVKPDYFDGKILIRTEKYAGYKYGDEIIAEGKIEIAAEDDDFSWKGYLLGRGIYAVMLRSEISIANSNRGNAIYAGILSAKQYIKKKIEQSAPGNGADFLLALILGYKSNISEYWQNIFSKTGTSHIISISGLHISIISGMFMLALLEAGISRKKAFWIIAVFLAAYVILTGMSASAMRAGIMGFIALFAVKVGRLSNPKNILVMAGALMLALNPFLLRYDAGFQLSFLSIIGIFYFWPVLEKRTEKWPNPLKLKSALNLSLSAQIITLPLVIYHFKIISLIAPLANLIIVPLIPLIFLIAAIPLSMIFWHPAYLKILFLPYKELSGFILWALEGFSNVPAINISINRAILISLYGLLFFLSRLALRQNTEK